MTRSRSAAAAIEAIKAWNNQSVLLRLLIRDEGNVVLRLCGNQDIFALRATSKTCTVECSRADVLAQHPLSKAFAVCSADEARELLSFGRRDVLAFNTARALGPMLRNISLHTSSWALAHDFADMAVNIVELELPIVSDIGPNLSGPMSIYRERRRECTRQLVLLCSRLPQLKRLVNHAFDAEPTTDVARALSSHCPLLESVQWSASPHIIREGERSWARHFPNLTELAAPFKIGDGFGQFNFTGGLDAAALVEVMQACTRITSLSFIGDLDGIENIPASSCSRIKRLSFESCNFYPDMVPQFFSRCELDELEMVCCPPYEFLDEPAESFYALLAASQPRLTTLTMHGDDVDDADCGLIFSHLTQLRVLAIQNNGEVGNDTIAHILDSTLPATLTQLDFSHCNFEHDQVIVLLEACPNLEKFTWNNYDEDDIDDEFREEWEAIYADLKERMEAKGGTFEGELA